MNAEQINKTFGVPIVTLSNWEKRRPDYFRYLSNALPLMDCIATDIKQELFSASKPKEVNLLLGLEGTFAKTVMGINPRTVLDWINCGKNGLYIGLLLGAIKIHIEEHLKQNGKTIEDLKRSDMCVLDLIYVWRHRPAVLDRLINTL